jgi:uncharacterized membrane protein (Fun14 family)
MMSRVFGPQVTLCETNNRDSKRGSLEPDSMFNLIRGKFSSSFLDKGAEILSEPETYYGFTAGACTGFALKKVAKAAAFTFGAVFAGFQLASHSGYVNINWGKVEKDVKSYLPDRYEDESKVVEKTVEWLTTNTGIAATVFTTGFVLGLKIG